MLPAKRALLSVSDKSGLVELARGIVALGIEILSTGGTHRHLEEAGISVTQVSEVTRSPEILDGRVKTLHPAIHGAILADRGRSSHLAELKEQGIEPIDLVVVNLYPFQQTVERPAASFLEIVEAIDIGGPCMLRGAAKNHQGVVVVVDPEDYPQVLAALQASGGTVPESLRRQLAVKAFRHTQAYDLAIANWLEAGGAPGAEPLPARLHLDLVRELVPRYGENPHQHAAVYRRSGGEGPLGGAKQLQGKELSWNNLLDADAARRLVSLFEEPAVVIVKHNNPCGVGRGASLGAAYQGAHACDPLSAFGSVIAVNRPASGDLAEAMAELFVEVLVAPRFEEAALELYARKKNLRLLQCPVYKTAAARVELRSIDGGLLAQSADDEAEDAAAWHCPTRVKPSAEQARALEFVWKVCRHVKSNAIVIGSEQHTLGIGAGQMSRVDACRLAIDKAQQPVQGAVAASDAFFPFRDGVDALGAAGLSAIIQPGGSRRDQEVIAAADQHGVAMVLTGRRHFKH